MVQHLVKKFRKKLSKADLKAQEKSKSLKIKVMAIAPGYYKSRIITEGVKFIFSGPFKKDEETGVFDVLPLWVQNLEKEKEVPEIDPEFLNLEEEEIIHESDSLEVLSADDDGSVSASEEVQGSDSLI